jgi:DNA-binding XRE family transcriptional regulator
MLPTLLVSERPAFEDAWRSALTDVGVQARLVSPSDLTSHVTSARVVIIDAASPVYDEDELLSSAGLTRALGITTIVCLPETRAFAGIEDLLEDLCASLLVRGPSDVRRIAAILARRVDTERRKRFEYLTVSPRPSELLAVLGDGTAKLIPRPASEIDDGSDIASISFESDAQRARLRLSTGHEFTLLASDVAAVGVNHTAPSNGLNGAISIDGARLGARLRELRLAAGLTQAELARRTGIHRPNIARVEAGRHTPSLETLARLASAIGVPTTHVLAER